MRRQPKTSLIIAVNMEEERHTLGSPKNKVRNGDRWAGLCFANTVAGNVYVNRNMIGAVVGVQPFGGTGLSGTGPKAGGPHYLTRFTTERTLTVNTTATGGNTALLSLD